MMGFVATCHFWRLALVALVLLVALDVGPTTATADLGAPDSGQSEAMPGETLIVDQAQGPASKLGSAAHTALEEKNRNEANTPLARLDANSEVRRPCTSTPNPAPRATPGLPATFPSARQSASAPRPHPPQPYSRSRAPRLGPHPLSIAARLHTCAHTRAPPLSYTNCTLRRFSIGGARSFPSPAPRASFYPSGFFLSGAVFRPTPSRRPSPTLTPTFSNPNFLPPLLGVRS